MHLPHVFSSHMAGGSLGTTGRGVVTGVNANVGGPVAETVLLEAKACVQTTELTDVEGRHLLRSSVVREACDAKVLPGSLSSTVSILLFRNVIEEAVEVAVVVRRLGVHGNLSDEEDDDWLHGRGDGRIRVEERLTDR